MRLCTKCGISKPQTEEFFYPFHPARYCPSEKHWQSYCKCCWVDINAANKLRRKLKGK
jgi:hypothetical protein